MDRLGLGARPAAAGRRGARCGRSDTLRTDNRRGGVPLSRSAGRRTRCGVDGSAAGSAPALRCRVDRPGGGNRLSLRAPPQEHRRGRDARSARGLAGLVRPGDARRPPSPARHRYPAEARDRSGGCGACGRRRCPRGGVGLRRLRTIPRPAPHDRAGLSTADGAAGLPRSSPGPGPGDVLPTAVAAARTPDVGLDDPANATRSRSRGSRSTCH